MFELRVEIPGLPKMPNQLLGAHWITRSGHAKKWKQLVFNAVVLQAERPPQPLVHAALTLIRCSAKEPDTDGLVGSFKPVIDGLVKCGVLADDKPSNIGIPDYRWERAKPKQGKIKILVKEKAGEI